jgi:hypothetical protein
VDFHNKFGHINEQLEQRDDKNWGKNKGDHF